MTKKYLGSLACLLLLLCCRSTRVPPAVGSVESLPDLEEVLEAYVSASGGHEALLGIDDRLCEGNLTWQFPNQEPSEVVIPARILAAAPDRWRLYLDTSVGPQGMGFDGSDGWVQNSDRIYVDGRQKNSKLAFLFSARGPLRLAEFFPDLGRITKETIGQRPVYRVDPLDSAGQEEYLCFDAQSGLLIQIGDDLRLGDFREVDGVTYPFRIEVNRGENTATYMFDRILHNVSLPSEKTSRPPLDLVFQDAFAGLTGFRVLPLLIDFPSGHEDMNVPCRDGRFLYDLICDSNYKRGLEIGTFTGYSALWFGMAFQRTGGELITLEIDREPGEEAQRIFHEAGLEAVIDARIVDAFAEIPKLSGEFDFVFIDAWKPDYMRFLELIRERIVPGGVLVAHNVTNHARDMQDFLKAVQEDPGLETTLHEISAEGMSVSFVRAQVQNDPEHIRGLIRIAEDESSGIPDRRTAVRALANFPTLEVVEAIDRILTKEGRALGYPCTQALAQIGTDPALDSLIAALRRYPENLSNRDVLEVLKNRRPEALLPILFEILKQDSWWTWNLASEALVEVGAPVEETLIGMLEDEEYAELRRRAACILGKIPSEMAVDPLIALLDQKDWMVRNEAVVALARIQHGLSLQPELKEILDKTPGVRWAADFLAGDASRLDRPGYAAEIAPPAGTPYDLDSGISIPSYPELLQEQPQTPSPLRTPDRQEFVEVITKGGEYALVPVNIENGAPYVYARHGKGKQLAVDAADFPSLAATGLHSEEELEQTYTITGRSIAEITALGRPERSSGIGFMALDEDIISVLKGDNRLVKAMGLTHTELAVPMFHMWNLVLEQTKAYNSQQRPFADVDHFLYFGKRICFEEIEFTKGWQESIFEDEIFGGCQIQIRRDMDAGEREFLQRMYADLNDSQMSELEARLTRFHTGEMEPYYIMRYGFYEGHTDYRVDPITIAFVFGLRSLEELETVFSGRLYEVLTSHFFKE